VPEVRSQLPIAKTVEDARRSLDLLVEDEHAPKKKRREPEVREYQGTMVAVLTGDESDEVEMAKAHMVRTKTAHEARVEHGRDYPSLIQAVTEEVDAERVVFAFSRRSPEKMEEGLKLIGSIMHKVTRPIVIVRGRTDD
jgi:hypothetical protein